LTFGNQCDEKTSFAILDIAWDGGVNFIDTADVYPLPPELNTVGATETIIGNWLHSHPGRRHETISQQNATAKWATRLMIKDFPAGILWMQ